MDLQKTKIYLDKLNREFARMTKDPDNIVRLDVDIMASYVRELYDAIHSADEAPRHESHAPKKAQHARHHIDTPMEVAPPAVAAPPIVEASPPPRVHQEEAPAPAPPPPVEPKHAPVMASHSKSADPSPGVVDMLFEEKQAKELSEKLSELPIADLKKAIALNDRLLLTSELFGGDGKAFEASIGSINALNSFDEAQAYLVEHCVVRYGWTEKKKLEVAKNFIKLVRRRFK